MEGPCPSLAATLDRVAAWTRPEVVGASAWGRIGEVARRLPAALTRTVYLERWLGSPAGRVDLILNLDEDGRRVLTGDHPRLAGSLAGALRSHPSWARVEAFGRRWARAGLLRRDVSGVWLEFDLPPAIVGCPPPRVFVGFRGDRGDSAAAWQTLAAAALRPLGATQLPRALRRCLDRLPPSTRLLYVGMDPGRPDSALRLCLLGIADDDLLPYLEAVGWPGDRRGLAESVLVPFARARNGRGRQGALIHLDLGPELLPRIGLEYAFDRRCQLAGGVDEQAFLDHLVERGLCDAAAREALPTWPGRSTELLRHQLWPSRLTRRLNHVKATYEARRSLELKAYLCFFDEPLRVQPRAAWTASAPAHRLL